MGLLTNWFKKDSANSMADELHFDLQLCLEQYKRAKKSGNKKLTEGWLRNSIRAMFAEMTAILKHVHKEQNKFIDWYLKRTEGPLSAEVKVNFDKLQLANDSHFAEWAKAVIRGALIALRWHKDDIDQQFEGNGWRHLTEAVKIRRRIIHPGGLNAMAVTEADFETVSKAFDWYRGVLQIVEEGIREMFAREGARLGMDPPRPAHNFQSPFPV